MAVGVAAGTVVMTADGALPVEFLVPGDRVVTRTGMARVACVRVTSGRMDVVRIAPSTLGHGRPDDTVVMAAGQPVLLRDWRAQALFGAAQAVVPVARLADGTLVRKDRMEVRLFDLRLDRPGIVQAGGIEIACAASPVPA
jgi:hypothetical protein